MRLVVKTFSKRLLLSFLLFFCAASVFAQNSNKLLKEGSKYFEKGNHRIAVTYFEKAISEEPNNAMALYLAGISYMTFDKEKAADYIYRAQEIDPEVDVDLLFWLGRAEHVNYNFDQAIEHFKNYQKSLPKREQFQYDLASMHIQHARNAKHEIENPKEIFVRNLGPSVNSIYSEHSPAISSDDNYLVFTSRGKSVTGGKESGDGEYFEDVFETSRLGPNDWRAVRAVPGDLNGPWHEACIQLFDKDTKMLLYRSDNDGDIMVAERQKDGAWGSPQSISDRVNSKFYESDAFITPDGKTLFFSTNQYSQGSNLDLYKVERRENGEWGNPVSLGAAINSPHDEDSPFLANDGTLYFASRGHNTMGGYDIFKSTYNAATQQWSKPVNMGVPINSPDDDTYYRLSHDGRYAYLSSYRIGGYGEKDIYTVTFQNAAHIAGQVFSKYDSSAIAGVEVRFRATKADKQPLHYENTIKNASDNYTLDVLAGITYQVEILKDNKVIAKQEVKVPAEKNKDNTVKLVNNFYVDYGSVKPKEEAVIAAITPEPEKLMASTSDKPIVAPVIEEIPPVEEEIMVQPPVMELQNPVKTVLEKKSAPVLAAVTKVKPVRVKVAPKPLVEIEPEEPEVIAVVAEKPAEVLPAPVEEEIMVQPPIMELQQPVKAALKKLNAKSIASVTNVKPVRIKIAPKPVVALEPEEPEIIAAVTEKPAEVVPDKTVVATPEKKAEPAPEKPAVAAAEKPAVAKKTPPVAARTTARPAATKEPVVIEETEEEAATVVAFESIFFDVGSFNLRPTSVEALDRVVKMLNENKDVRIKVQGYTMVEVVSDYSRNLSRNRAKVAYDYLIYKGISPLRLVLSTYNNATPIAANTSEESMQQNRMTRFIVISNDGK